MAKTQRPTLDQAVLTPYVPVDDGERVVIVDLDGTICLRNGRSPYDESRVIEDDPNMPVITTIHALLMASRIGAVIFMSGRKDSCRPATMLWLKTHVPALLVNRRGLFMREDGDTRADWEVKLDLFNTYVRNYYNVFAVFDDRDQVVALWRALGLTCFQVADGKF